MIRVSAFMPASRYHYDLKCKSSEGWAQLDTRQDAPYYGNWVNPLTFETICYCEGDVTHHMCRDAEDFRVHMIDVLGWQFHHGYTPVIDGMCSETIIAAFKALGLGAWLDSYSG